MIRVLVVAFAAVLAAGGCAQVPPEVAARREAAETAQLEAEARAEIARQERDAAIADLQARDARLDRGEDDRWRPLRVGAWNVFLAVVPLLATAAAAAVAWSRRGLVMPRKADGALPFHLATLTVDDSRAALAGRQAADLALASQQPVPQTVTYSPSVRTDWRNNQEVAGGELPELPAAARLSFRDLRLDPATVYLGSAAAGQDVAGPVTRPWEQFLTLALGGLSGSGKTWTAVSLTLQAMAAGHRVVLADPHAANPDSLAARLAPVHGLLWRPVATTDEEVSAAANAVERVMRGRAEGRDADLTPVTFVVDEFTKVMRGDLAGTIAAILEGITQEGRKLGVRAILLGQRWSASSTGGNADLRDTIPDVLLHRMRRADARMLTGWPIEELPDTSKLEPGECFLLSGDEVVRVMQPYMTAADVAAVASTLAVGPPPVLASVPGRSPVGPPSGPAGELEEGQDPPGPDGGPTPGPTDEFRRKVIDLLLAGDGVAGITDTLASSRQRSGGAWKRTREQVEAVLRDELAARGTH